MATLKHLTKKEVDEKKEKDKEKEVISKRKKEYGTPREQIENILENGIEAERQRVEDIKKKYPKES